MLRTMEFHLLIIQNNTFQKCHSERLYQTTPDFSAESEESLW